ncbi:DUF4269 domain-containing protein [Dyadobacter subterraneus]|uniref:DUF4269 domain-containing protein n=1 Tax=Dyadobacter subterraneus TaxID=2773304 RepID=A0ABR9WEP6_9BACT|nr:DUF4269 domain-containing protein [Dyadobacter subterraneus]MBE9463396.1 DUF4269 domain-containing protein [Dyadobacter subterraneus]
MIDFTDISYLKNGNIKQRAVFNLLINNRILDLLATFNPILAGTIPLNIDIEKSDLDIICYWKDKDEFVSVILSQFSDKESFQIKDAVINNQETVIANFFIDDFEIEIFGQNIPSHQQTAFRHMLVEYKILLEKGEDFRNAVIELKRQGIKTEPAFAELLGLTGNPYESLLAFEEK